MRAPHEQRPGLLEVPGYAWKWRPQLKTIAACHDRFVLCATLRLGYGWDCLRFPLGCFFHRLLEAPARPGLSFTPAANSWQMPPIVKHLGLPYRHFCVPPNPLLPPASLPGAADFFLVDPRLSARRDVRLRLI
jgi:hypothetical protein